MLETSVIVPTYNRAGFLQEALASIRAQRRQPLEVIVVDDGSADDTCQVVSQAAPSATYLQQDHAGVSSARNAGLEVATGDLIAWLDSDDLWGRMFLETMVATLESDPALDGVYCGWCGIDATGQPVGKRHVHAVEPETLYDTLIEANYITTSTLLLRRECYDAMGPFDTDLPVCEDYDMFLRMAKRFRVQGLDRVLVSFRLHAGSTLGESSRYSESRLRVVSNHFGPPNARVGDGSERRRRAYGFAYRAVTIRCLQDGANDRAWEYMERAVSEWPGLLERQDTFYELACGDQQRVYRGVAPRVDLDRTGAEMLRWLERWFTDHASQPQARARPFGQAYLALAMLSEQAGRWPDARKYLLAAVRHDPSLLAQASVLRRLGKLALGESAVCRIRKTFGRPRNSSFLDSRD